jgi:hypothetical protein
MLKSIKSSAVKKTAATGTYSTKESRERFERAVDVAVATKPIHRPVAKKAARKRR